MANKHSALIKGHWHSFFSYEVDFLDWINANTEVITSLEENDLLKYHDIYDAKGQVIIGYSKPPKAFRHVCYLRNADDAAELLERTKRLKEAYQLPVITAAKESGIEPSELENRLNKFPSRFPEFYENIDQINLSINSAFSSKKIDHTKPDEKVIVQSRAMNDAGMLVGFEEDKLTLINFGLKSASIHKEIVKERVVRVSLEVDAIELLNVAKADSLQLRIPTGNQYRARLYDGSGSTRLVRFGLIILDAHCHTHTVLPQPLRKHSLQKVGRQFELPVSSDFTLWINE